MNIIEQAIQAAASYGQKKHSLSDEGRATLPSVQITGNNQEIVIGFHLGEAHYKGPNIPRKIYFPFFEARIDVSTMEVHGQQISGKDFGVNIPDGEFIGDLGDLLKFDYHTY